MHEDGQVSSGMKYSYSSFNPNNHMILSFDATIRSLSDGFCEDGVYCEKTNSNLGFHGINLRIVDMCVCIRSNHEMGTKPLDRRTTGKQLQQPRVEDAPGFI